MRDLLLISSSPTFRDIFSVQANKLGDLISNVYTVPSFLEELIQSDDTITIVDGSDLYNGSLNAVLVSSSRIPIVIVKNKFGNNEVFKLLKSGVKGLVSVEECCNSFLEMIYKLRKGELFLGESQYNRLFTDLKNSLDLEVLTNREREVLPLMMKGMTFSEIAETLNVSYETIKSHTRNIYKKLNVKTKRELLQYDLTSF